MEKIIKIEEVVEKQGWHDMEGYTITTDKQVIKMLIDNGQSCCEDWGYFMSEDNLNDFLGAEILDISLTDETLNTKKYNEYLEYGLDGGGVIFVNITTTKGVLQFTAYNSHNGYYGHDAKIISEQLKFEDCL